MGMRINLVFLLVFLGAVNIVVVGESSVVQNVVIGMSLDLHPSSGGPIINEGADLNADLNRAATSVKIYNGLNVWNQIFGDVVYTYENISLRYKLRILDDGGNITKMIANYQALANNPNINFLFGPIQTDFTLAAAFTWENANKLMISTSAASQDVVLGKKSSYSLLTPSSRYLLTAFPIWQNAGLKTIAYINEDILQFSQSCDALYPNAPDYNMVVIGNRTLTPAGGTLTADQLTENLKALEYVRGLEPDVLVVCAYTSNSQQILMNTKALNYLPSAIHFMLLQDSFLGLLEANFITASTVWLDNAQLAPDQWYGSPSSFSEIYEQAYGVLPDGISALGAIGPIVFEQAVAISMATNNDLSGLSSESVREALQTLNMNTFYGNIGFSADHLCLHDNIVVQFVNGKIVPIAPFSVSEGSFISPMPTYNERVFVPPHYFGTPDELAVGIVAIFLLFLCFLLAVVVFKFWRDDIYLWMVLLGCTLCLLVLFLWMREVNTYTCQGLPWMLGGGICMLYQAMALLCYRTEAMKKRATNTHKVTRLLKFTGVILAIEVLILILITTISPLKSTVVVTDPLRPGLNTLSCQGSTLITPILIAILVLYHIILMVYSIVLAWKVYAISKHLALALVNISVFLIIVLISQMNTLYQNATPSQAVTIKLLLRCFGLMLSSFGSTCLVFYPKLKGLVKKETPHNAEPEDEENGVSMKVHTPLSTLVQSLQAELEQQRERIRELEESLKMQPSPVMKTVTIQGPSKFIYYSNTPYSNNIHLTKDSPENPPHAVSFSDTSSPTQNSSPPFHISSLHISNSPPNHSNGNILVSNNSTPSSTSPISTSLSQIITKDKDNDDDD